MVSPDSKATLTLKKLKNEYPEAGIALYFNTPLELLVATILSAQCTDKQVNIVTKALFKKYRNIGDYAKAKTAEFQKDIYSTGFYKNKAKNIIDAAKRIEAEFRGKVPSNMVDLLSLAGVARKTANIVLAEAFDKTCGIAVDTHVKRVSMRLSLTKNTNPDKIEADLMNIFDEKDWISINRVFIAHGRSTCKARSPKCRVCPVNDLCNFSQHD